VCLTGLTGVEPLSESCSVSTAGTGLTGGAHRSDRCGSVDSRFGVPLRSRVGRLCVLVPRSSGTPVTTWAWPTWVVSQRRVLEAAFILLEFRSPLRRIFIGSHSLPPPLVRRIGPSASHLWDLPRVNCLTRVSLGIGVAGLFLVCLELFCYILCRVFLSCSLCFGGVFCSRA
jgi:hypothetical protein